MKKMVSFLVVFFLLSVMSFELPVLDLKITLVDESYALCGWLYDCDDDTDDAEETSSGGVTEPSMILLLAAGFAGYGIHRRLKKRNKE